MGLAVEVDNMEDLCNLMCNNIVNESKVVDRRKYLVYYGRINGDSFTEYFNTEKEALEYGEDIWLHLTKNEQEKVESFFVGYCNDYNEEDMCSETNNYYTIKNYKM